MATRRPAEVFPPGDFIKEELEARGWTQTDLAAILGRPTNTINEIVLGKHAITPQTAAELGEAFGTNAQFWLNLETAYQLWKLGPRQSIIGKRARIYEMGPIKEMIRRQWIESSENVDVLEAQVCEFFEISRLDEKPNFWAHAARQSTSYKSVSPPQRAWLFRARNLSRALKTSHFTKERFESCLENLRPLLLKAEDIKHVPRILAESGIRLVVVEALQKTWIDGARFWIDPHTPAIALTLRYDRIDYFWFTLLHELHHVKNKDGLSNKSNSLDIDLVGEKALSSKDKPRCEQEADSFTAEYLIPRKELEDFIARVRPFYSKKKIVGFANSAGIHPGIVVGQLQYLKEIQYTHSRDLLCPIRDILIEVALTDGWGSIPPI